MLNVILENVNGDQLSFGMDSPFTITEIDGLNPPDAEIMTTQLSLMDGAMFNNAKVNMRTINIAFAIEIDPAKNRLQVFKVIKPKQLLRLYYHGDYRHVYIDGYVQSVTIDYFEMVQIVTVTMLCPQPFFMDLQETVDELSNIVSTFHFPFASPATPILVFGYPHNDVGFTVENKGDVDTGLIIELFAVQAISNPKIYNYVTQEFIGLNRDMFAGDLITIDTRTGHKTVTVLRNGQSASIFNSVMKDSTWLQLSAFGDTFVYEVGTGNASDLLITMKHHNLYEGV